MTTRLRMATSPVRQCADLRRATRALRSAATCASALKTAGARFPRAVLGEDLMAMMSAQFRQLQQESATGPGTWEGQEASRMFQALSTEAAGARQPVRPAAVSRAVPKFEPPRTGPRDDTAMETPAAGASRSEWLDDGVPRAADSIPEWGAPAGPDVLPGNWTGAQPDGVTAPEFQPAGTLVNKLREYFDLERRSAAARAASAVASETARSRRAAEPAVPAQPAVSAPPAPRLVDQVKLARLRAFVGESAGPPAGLAQVAAAPSPAPSNGYAFQEFGAASSAIELAGEFADRLARTLREQALQHGIDIT